MAATAIKLSETLTQGGNVQRIECFKITFDSDATVEVPTFCDRIFGASFVELVSGGSADLPSIDETASTDGSITVPSTRTITVDTAANSTRSFLMTIIGQ